MSRYIELPIPVDERVPEGHKLIEINNPNLKHCKTFDIHCPCPKCTVSQERMCMSNCRYCEEIVKLQKKNLLSDDTVKEMVRDKEKCLPSSHTYHEQWKTRAQVIREVVKKDMSAEDKIRLAEKYIKGLNLR